MSGNWLKEPSLKKSVRLSLMTALATTYLAGSSASAAADENMPEYALDDVVITAERIPSPRRETPANVAIITADDIIQKGYTDVAEALEDVNGVVIDRSSGEDSVRLNGDERVIVMIDGQRLNNDQGSATDRHSVDLKMIPSMKNIERIEVVKGAGSALYGSDAVGGVINIITKKTKETVTEIDVRTGSWGRHTYELSNEGSDGTFSWQLTAGIDRARYFKYKADGDSRRMPSSDYKNNSFSLRLTNQIDDRSSVTLAAMHRTIDANSYYNFAPSAHKDTIYNSASATYNFKEGTAAPGFIRYFHNYKSSDFSGKFNTTLQGIDYQNGWQIDDNNTLIVGAEWHQSDSTNKQNGYKDKKVTNTAIYLQDTLKLGAKWRVVPGVRLDHHSDFGSHWSPKLAVSYLPSHKTSLYASWGRVYKAPTTDDLYYYADWGAWGGYYGNTDLKPERGHVESIGIAHEFDTRTRLSLDLFRSSLINAIHWYNPGGGLNYYATNIAKEKKHGLELLFNKVVDDNWSYELGYSYTHTEAIDDHNITATKFLNHYNQPNGFRLGLSYRHAKWCANLTGRMASGLDEYYYDGSRYAIFDLSTSYNITEDATIYLKLNNITNQAWPTSGSKRNPGAGRYFEVGAKHRF